MKTRSTVVIAFLLIISAGNCIRIISDGNIRTVEFVSVFVFGVLAGILSQQLRKTKTGN